MNFGVPWGVKGIRPEARKTAKEAARRAGMSLEDWLNSVILQQAEHEGIDPGAPRADTSHGDGFADMNQRLDDLTRRIEQITRTGPAAYAPRQNRNDSEQFASRPVAPPLAPAIPPGPPSVQPPPGIDRAVAEVSARRRALNGEPAPTRQMPQMPIATPAPMAQTAAPMAAPAPTRPPPQMPVAAPAPMAETTAPMATPAPRQAPLPAQDLSGLEAQLRRITDQIETLRKPGVEEAISALRNELGEIGHALSEALPRNAIESLERQILELAVRIDEGRQAGVDQHTLAGIESGLAEVRHALQGLTPAENLVGFNEAIAGLAHKIDLIVAQNDPATLQQLESAIITLRGMVDHVATNEAVAQVANEVQALSEKVDNVARAAVGSDALNSLDHRVTAIADALAARVQNGSTVPPLLESLVQSLSDKIDMLQSSRGDNVALGHLEDRIVSLVEKLDASESRLGQLEAIERGLSDLLVHVEDMRSSKVAEPLPSETLPAVDELKQNMARTQDALEAVHGTLGHVVDRLAMIEKGIRGDGRPRPVAEDAPAPPGNALPAHVAPPPPPPPQPQAAPRRRVATSLPINGDSSADEPLEPGSGPPQFSARIAASEAALGGVGPAAAAPGGKSNFIAAARRAAQAAMQQGGNAAAPRVETASELEETKRTSLRAKLMRRVKSVFIAASIIAVVVGGFQIAGTVLKLGGAANNETAKTDNTANMAVPAAAPEATPSRSVEPLESPAIQPLTAPTGKGPVSSPSSLNTPTPNAPSLFGPSLMNTPPASAPAPHATKSDTTGSVPDTAGNQHSDPSTEIAPATGEQLPTAIGGERLRKAAIAGDVGAAYEVALRYAEGRGVTVNAKEAAHWFARAAGAGLAAARFRYASMLEKGQGVKKDQQQARELYLAAAAQGHAKAMHNLAVLYAEGINGKPDYSAAVKWFHQAALHGVADSQYNLGILTARGFGTERDFGASYKWFALAAAQGDQESAKKRDEIAKHLDAETLAAAKKAVTAFTIKPQPTSATAVPKPQGGWDIASDAATPRAAPIKTKAVPQPPLPANAPLSLGSFTVGKQ
jgi:localization factor PodJL